MSRQSLRLAATLTVALAAELLSTSAPLWAEDSAHSRGMQRAASFSSLFPLGREVYYTAFEDPDPILRSNTLYRSDGTPGGTTSVAQICGGPICGGPGGIIGTWGSTLFWSVLNATSQTNQLWAVRRGSQPELLVTAEPYASGAFDFKEIAPGKLAFRVGLFNRPGNAVYTTDGTAAGTIRHDDGTEATLADANSPSFAWQGSLLYENLLGTWREAPENPAGPTPPLNGFAPYPIDIVGDRILFLGLDSVNNQTVVQSVDRQGTTSQLLVAEAFSSFSVIGSYGDYLLFKNQQFAWATDGTPAGTFKLPPELSLPTWLGKTRQRVFLLDRDEQLIVSDLTPAGTYTLLTFGSGPFSQVTQVGDHVFYRQGPYQAVELGVTDGTSAGTRKIEIEPGETGSEPTLFYNLDDRRVVFSATTTTHGQEPWISDGTAEGTYQLEDVVPGPGSSHPRSFTLAGNRLLFVIHTTEGSDELRAIDLPEARPACPADRLCLLGGRFEVAVRAVASGQEFPGKRAFGISESGIFTFFSPNNWEFLVKVLDGCAINNHFWVYAAAATDVAYELEVKDRATGQTRTYTNEGGVAARPILDGQAFASCGLETPPATYSLPEPLQEDARRCPDDFTELCLSDRFRVKAEWQTATGSGKALPVPTGSADSGLFTFFSPSNWELMVKVLDGCDINNRHWVFAAGTTDVAWTLTVKDQQTGETKVYTNPLGNPSRTITDSEALGGCP